MAYTPPHEDKSKFEYLEFLQRESGGRLEDKKKKKGRVGEQGGCHRHLKPRGVRSPLEEQVQKRKLAFLSMSPTLPLRIIASG